MKRILFENLFSPTQEQKDKGVVAASAGNHALALSYHGKELNISVTVVMPKIAPLMKVQACRSYGANVIVTGKDISEVNTGPYSCGYVNTIVCH